MLFSNLKDLQTRTPDQLVTDRFKKFRKMGEFKETAKKATGVS
jgi:acetyl-CoA carboxylase alpha subunit